MAERVWAAARASNVEALRGMVASLSSGMPLVLPLQARRAAEGAAHTHAAMH